MLLAAKTKLYHYIIRFSSTELLVACIEMYVYINSHPDFYLPDTHSARTHVVFKYSKIIMSTYHLFTLYLFGRDFKLTQFFFLSLSHSISQPRNSFPFFFTYRVRNWALKFGVDLWEFGRQFTKMNEIRNVSLLIHDIFA